MKARNLGRDVAAASDARPRRSGPSGRIGCRATVSAVDPRLEVRAHDEGGHVGDSQPVDRPPGAALSPWFTAKRPRTRTFLPVAKTPRVTAWAGCCRAGTRDPVRSSGRSGTAVLARSSPARAHHHVTTGGEATRAILARVGAHVPPGSTRRSPRIRVTPRRVAQHQVEPAAPETPRGSRPPAASQVAAPEGDRGRDAQGAAHGALQTRHRALGLLDLGRDAAHSACRTPLRSPSGACAAWCAAGAGPRCAPRGRRSAC